MNIGLIGAGAIGQYLLNELTRDDENDMAITSVLVRSQEKVDLIKQSYGVDTFVDIQEFLHSNIDIVVEAADIQAVENLMPTVLKHKPAVVISVGAFGNERLLEELTERATSNGQRIYLPAGAIGGLDLLQNAHAVGGVSQVSLLTRKPAHTLTTEVLEKEKVVFEGNAKEAIQLYPKNMNISIVLALASIGFENVNVTLIADPGISQNNHRITIVGTFGEVTIEVKNNALPSNPKTSYLAALSIIGTLNRLQSVIQIG